jgi:hypothetical protein
VSLTVVVQETALRALARIRAENKEAFTSIGRALAALAEQPHPDQAMAWGGRILWPSLAAPARSSSRW